MTRSTPPKIEFVYFDLGNILLSFDPEIACRNLGAIVDRDPSAIKQALYESGLQDELEHGRLSTDRFVDELAGHLSIETLPVEPAKILDAISDMFSSIDSMIGILSRVKAKVGQIGLLSNTCQPHWDWIGRQGFPTMQTELDQTVLSFDVGSMKPAPEIYKAAEAACQVDPSNILFIDDRDENIVAARGRGWNAEVCFGGPEAIAVLERYEVLV